LLVEIFLPRPLKKRAPAWVVAPPAGTGILKPRVVCWQTTSVTLDHQIGGFSQQQGSGGSILFTSQFGTVNLSSLPVVSQNGQPF
jgi:hypothetical protein